MPMIISRPIGYKRRCTHSKIKPFKKALSIQNLHWPIQGYKFLNLDKCFNKKEKKSDKARKWNGTYLNELLHNMRIMRYAASFVSASFLL